MKRKPMSLAVLFASLVPGGCSAESPSEQTSPSSVLQDQATRTQSDVSAQRVLIFSDVGEFTAELVDNEATRSLVRMLPLTIEMGDPLRQEKTGVLPSPLPASPRQVAFSAGTLGLWSSDDFVLYYREGSAPAPGIVVLGRVIGDVSAFDRPGSVSVRIERAE